MASCVSPKRVAVSFVRSKPKHTRGNLGSHPDQPLPHPLGHSQCPLLPAAINRLSDKICKTPNDSLVEIGARHDRA